MNAFSVFNVHSLPVDHFLAPTIESSQHHLVVEVDITSSETQVFLIDITNNHIYLDSELWLDSQCKLIQRALHMVQSGLAYKGELVGQTILLGVWHFGHLIGDHAHQLIHHCRKGARPPSRKLRISSSFQGIYNVASILNLPRMTKMLKVQESMKYNIRVFSLFDCTCVFPSLNKSIPLSIAQEHIRLSVVLSSYRDTPTKVFLTSARQSRIKNIKDVVSSLSQYDWIVLNPFLLDPSALLRVIANAKFLISENGSILFNCFLSRSSVYYVFASERVKDLSEHFYYGGGIYNKYHEGVLQYIYCPVIIPRHHAYSDQIEITLDPKLCALA